MGKGFYIWPRTDLGVGVGYLPGPSSFGDREGLRTTTLWAGTLGGLEWNRGASGPETGEAWWS